MNKLLKVALIGGGAVVLSQVCFDLGKSSMIHGLKDDLPEAYEEVMEIISDSLKYHKFNPIDKARAKFVFNHAI